VSLAGYAVTTPLPVNDKADDALCVVCNDVSCPDLLTAERLLAEEVALVEVPDELLLARPLLLRHLHLEIEKHGAFGIGFNLSPQENVRFF
jgi:hypothetical protein